MYITSGIVKTLFNGCVFTSVASVCVFRVERVQQVDGARGPGFDVVLLLMVR